MEFQTHTNTGFRVTHECLTVTELHTAAHRTVVDQYSERNLMMDTTKVYTVLDNKS